MRILIIDDDKKLCDSVKIALEAEPFVVDVVADGKEGYYLASTNEYDLIILDINLPEQSGLEICELLRREGRTMPIIILSVRKDTFSKVELLNIGADDYMSKPFSLQELLARVRALLRRPQQIESDVFTVGNISLDAKKNTVFRGAEEIYLSRKEFMLLEYLMRNRGSVLSRSMILEHVWDMNADPFSTTIESHILSLRRKLSSGKKDKFIRTIPGRGYKVG